MRKLRSFIPVLGILGLSVLFLKLPEIPNFFALFGCKTCSSSNPYLTLLGAAYFSLLVAVFLLFPNFPNSIIARGGLTWSVLLGFALSYVKFPDWCLGCLIAHACNILIWTIWVIAPSVKEEKPLPSLRQRLSMMLLVPIAVVALFSSLNLTFMAYGFKAKQSIVASHLKPGDKIPSFHIQTLPNSLPLTNEDAFKTRVIINFISPNCPYCQEQLTLLNSLLPELKKDSFRFINVSSTLPPNLDQYTKEFEWAEDKDGALRNLFQVLGYPTMFVLGLDGKIAEIIPGVPKQYNFKEK